MCGSMMTVFTGAAALLSVFTTGGLAQALPNAPSTETLAPSPLGTTTSDGALLVTMNYCSIIVNTQCQVSVMTSAANPPASASAAAPVETNGPAESNPVGVTSAVAPVRTAASSSSSHGADVPAPASPTAPSTAVGAPAMTTTAVTAAAAGIKALPPAAWVAAVLALAVLI